MKRPDKKNYPGDKEMYIVMLETYTDFLEADLVTRDERLLSAGFEIDNLSQASRDTFGDEWSK